MSEAPRFAEAPSARSPSSVSQNVAPVLLATVSGFARYATMTGVLATVFIVDDHEAFRKSARAMLEADGFRVVGESEDGEGALRAIATLRPHVVLLDIQLPGIDGFDVAARLADSADPPEVVLISSREAAVYGSRLGETPSRGFIPKRELSGKALAELVD